MLSDTSLLVYLHNRNNPNSRSASRSELLLGGAGRSSTCRRSLGLNERNGCVTGCLIPPTRPSADSWCRPVLWLCCPAEESDGDHWVWKLSDWRIESTSQFQQRPYLGSVCRSLFSPAEFQCWSWWYQGWQRPLLQRSQVKTTSTSWPHRQTSSSSVIRKRGSTGRWFCCLGLALFGD